MAVFKITFLGPILILIKLVGLINITYTVEKSGFLVKTTIYSTYYSLLELIRIFLLLMCTFIFLDPSFPFIQIILLLKFWVVIIAARISEIWIIKFINGIMKFDQKVTQLSTCLPVRQRDASTRAVWRMTLVSLFVYFVAFEFYQMYLWPPKRSLVYSFSYYLFAAPFVMDIAVVISSCFFLYNLYVRFDVLNDFWKRLPAGLVAVPGQWTDSEIAVLMDSIRLLHAELCELLKTFSLGYGPVLLAFFVFCFVNMLIHFFFMICMQLSITDLSSTENFLRNLIPHLLNVQIVFFMMSIIVAVSLINEKKRKIISYLRLYHISKLPEEIKRQVKMFMNQNILIVECDEIAAFGFFNINLNLVISILVLLITGLSTLIQMKKHPFVVQLVNDTKSFSSKQFKNVVQT